ncbi:MAG: M28 family peptidase [Vicinamibacterales bacterium]
MTIAPILGSPRPLASAVLLAGLLVAVPGAGQTARPTRTQAHVAALASPQTEGRLAGSPGERAAGDYLIAELRRIGARPLAGRSDYRIPFDFTAGTRDGGSRIAIECEPAARGCRAATFTGESQVRALSFSDNGEVSGTVVFAGYGIVVPDGQDFGYDSYAGLDVNDKIVVVLRYFPEEADPKTKAVLTRYSGLRYKALAARQRGARGLLVITGPNSPNAGETVPMTFDTALSGSGIAAVSASRAVADGIFAALDDPAKSLAAAQKALDSGNPHVSGFAIPGVTLRLAPVVTRETRTGANIVAVLPATEDVTGVEKPWIALGAHYDHLGRGDHGNSLASKNEVQQIHHGADDNASGSAAVLAVGERLSTRARKRHVLLQFWSGEELGLLGSAAYVAAPPVPVAELAAYLNFDMVGRMQDNKLTLQAAGTSAAWARMIEQANVAAGFDLLLQQDPYQPTDVATFNQAGVPCLNFFTGTHADYHRPSDTADKINYEDLDRIVDFAAGIATRLLDLDAAPAFTKVEQQITTTGGRAGVRVFTGTIPDYSTEVKGLLLSGVIGGGPAEAAGLQKGDVIVEIGGQTIANIYDYTYALETLKIGVPVTVAYVRNGERRETTLTPGARK